MKQSSFSTPPWFTPIPIAISILVYVVLVPIYSPFLIYRAIVILIWKLKRPDLDSMVSGYDTIFTSRKPGLALSDIVLCLVVDGEISASRIREMFQDRVAHLQDSTGKLIFRRLFQNFTTFLGYLFWKSDREFRLENHIRNYDYDTTSKIPKPSDDKTVQVTLAELTVAPWNPNRSPWELLSHWIISSIISDPLLHSYHQKGWQDRIYMG
ncbi:unnamed protein product [Allacma fusca]|uniref:Uncharacterized protein n=1 Tax=Allacma fusca TaxID=39272 RepID=A0A8J2NWX1_9HEXA|nr:unnamed protein product [Allacma fusca]